MSAFILLAVFFTLLFLASKPVYTQNSTTGSFQFDGHIRHYEVFFPQNFQANMPLVINLHGHDEPHEWYKRYTLLHEAADTSGFILVYPRGIDVSPGRPSWNIMSEDLDPQRSFPTTDDVGFISALIDTMHVYYDIDLARVYCCGYGTGGDMTFRMAGECGQRFAAIAAVASTLSDDAYNWQCICPMPVLHMNGTAEEYWNPYYEGREGMWPISRVIDYWLNMNHCTFQPDTFFVPDIVVEDSCTVQIISFTDCDDESELIHYKIIDGGCSWPGSTAPPWSSISNPINKEGNRNMDISANVEILNFFKRHQNPLVDIAFGKSTEIATGYVRPDGDTLRVTGQIANPGNHSATVFAIYKGENTSFQDSIQLFDDGIHQDGEASDNLWGGAKWLSDIDEDVFEVRLRTRDLDEGTIHDMQLSGLDYFTTIGPIRVDYFNIPWLSGNVVPVELFARNDGLVMDAADVFIELRSADSTVINITPSNRNTIDIGVGDTVKTPPTYFIYTVDSPEKINLEVLIYSAGNPYWSDQVVVDVLALDIVDQDKTVPTLFSLSQNYPNPFNPTTTINYKLPITNYVELSIYNLLGQKVATLINERQNAGSHQVEWDASAFASGVYYYRLITDAGFVQTKKLILLK
jgi:polyhydroxybutyrate depolymerase